MKTVTVLFQAVALGMLGLIAYNTGVGKMLPVHHPSWMSCDGSLSRALFYSTLLKQSDDLAELASRVREASTLDDIDRLVVDGTNIDARRTLWFESVSEIGKCQAQVFLKNPDKDGNNTAYIGFEVGGFAQPGRGILGSLTRGNVLQQIRLETLAVKWFKE